MLLEQLAPMEGLLNITQEGLISLKKEQKQQEGDSTYFLFALYFFLANMYVHVYLLI